MKILCRKYLGIWLVAVAVTSSCHCSDLGDRGSAAANFDSDPIVGPKRKLLQESSDISGLILDAIVLLFAFSLWNTIIRLALGEPTLTQLPLSCFHLKVQGHRWLWKSRQWIIAVRWPKTFDISDTDYESATEAAAGKPAETTPKVGNNGSPSGFLGYLTLCLHSLIIFATSALFLYSRNY